jgi:hypothetical protein
MHPEKLEHEDDITKHERMTRKRAREARATAARIKKVYDDTKAAHMDKWRAERAANKEGGTRRRHRKSRSTRRR